MNDDLREALNDTAGDLAQLIPNPQDWSNWIIYFLEELEDKAVDRVGFFEMLLEVQDYLSKRMDFNNLTKYQMASLLMSAAAQRLLS
jgi:hypothetical protein